MAPETAAQDPRGDLIEIPDCCVHGFHHVALVTDDLKTIVDFYAGLLGFRIIRAMRLPPTWGTGAMNRGNPPFEEIRYYFFALGKDCVLSFFEVPRNATPKADRNSVAGLQQIAFSCRKSQFDDLHRRLKAAGVKMEEPFEVIPGTFAFTFWDPFGVRLEALCAPDQTDTQKVARTLSQPSETIAAELETLSDDPRWRETARGFIAT